MHAITHADLRQAIAGKPVGVNGETFCTACGEAVIEGEPVGVYAYRLHDDQYWNVPRVFCDDCGHRAFIPTLGSEEAVVRAMVATLSDARKQSHQAVLMDPTIEEYSPPVEGSEP
jgi:hypothetical protein